MRFATAGTLLIQVVLFISGDDYQCYAFSIKVAPTRDALFFQSRSDSVRNGRADRIRWHRPSAGQALAPQRHQRLVLHASSDKAEYPSASGKATIRFSGIDLDRDTTTSNPIDFVLSLITSDIGSIVLGLVGLVILLVGRVIFNVDNTEVDDLAQETRSNLLAVFACGGVLLSGISKLDVTSALAQVVTLEGTKLEEPLILTDDKDTDESTMAIQWVLKSLLTATPAKTAVLLRKSGDASGGSWDVLALAGIVPDTWVASKSAVPSYTPILDRFQSAAAQETYLPTLQALPGKAEFTYLPVNAQAALLLPVRSIDGNSSDTVTVLALGSDQARSFTPRNVAWGQAVASRLAVDMESSPVQIQ